MDCEAQFTLRASPDSFFFSAVNPVFIVRACVHVVRELALLTEDDFREMQISIGMRRKIMTGLQVLQAGVPSTSAGGFPPPATASEVAVCAPAPVNPGVSAFSFMAHEPAPNLQSAPGVIVGFNTSPAAASTSCVPAPVPKLVPVVSPQLRVGAGATANKPKKRTASATNVASGLTAPFMTHADQDNLL